MDSQVLRRLTTPLTWYARISENDVGTKAFQTGVTVYCYVDGRTKRIISSSGEEVSSPLSLIMAGTATVSYMDEILYEGRRYPVQAVGKYPSLKTGNELIEVFL